jgi:putative transposase
MHIRSWKYRLYPSKHQKILLDNYLNECKTLWNSLPEFTKMYYNETGKFPTRKDLFLKVKGTPVFSQVAQNVADRLLKALRGMSARKKAGMKAGFPRFKPMERMKSITYPQFGFMLKENLELSSIGSISIRKHRELLGKIKTLTIKKSLSGKWYAIFTTEVAKEIPKKKHGLDVGVDLGIENFAYLSSGVAIPNPRHIKKAEKNLKRLQRQLSVKRKGSINRAKSRLKVAIAHESLSNKRRDFLHKISSQLVSNCSFIAMEALNVSGLSRGFLAKHVLDCSWAEFANMLTYKAEDAGCEVVFVDPAQTTQMCSGCGSVQKKALSERWHSCSCGASMHRDMNSAINILKKATAGTAESKACGEETSVQFEQVSSMKQDAPH